MERHDVVIIGGGQAGLAMSHHLGRRRREHILIERDRLGGRWHDERWKSLYFQFPNWSLRLPGHCYDGDDPEGFSHYSAVIEFLADYARKTAPPVRLGVEVHRLTRANGSLILDTSHGPMTANHVVVATGAFPSPKVPAFARHLSPSIAQLHSSVYKCPEQLPPGGVMVVGTGSSGGQIAEELHRAGRPLWVSVSRHRRMPRRHLGKDVLWWLYQLGWMDRTIDSFPDRRPLPAILVTGIDGGHDLDIRQFAMGGVTLLGSAVGADANYLHFADNLSQLLDDSDSACDEFVRAANDHAPKVGMIAEELDRDSRSAPEPHGNRIDLKAAGIGSIIWCTGYRPAFEWISIPTFDSGGAPIQQRGISPCPGLYFLGLHWMHTFKSGALFGVGDDAGHIARHIDRLPAG